MRLPTTPAPRLLLVCDIDGTLTFTRDRPEPTVLRQLIELASHGAGVRIAVATSRSSRNVLAWFPELVHRLDRICCHGALTISSSRISRHPVPVGSLEIIVERLAGLGADYCLERGTHFAASGPDALPWLGTAHRYVLPAAATRRDLTGVAMCSVADARQAAEGVRDLADVRLVANVMGSADIVAAGVAKGRALAELREPEEHVVVLGNDHDDLQMLLAADLGYVIGEDLTGLDELPHVDRAPATPSSVAQLIAQLRPPALFSTL